MSGQVGVLIMAHGTPQRHEDIAAFYTRIRRGRPPSPEQLAELEGRYAAIGGLSPLTERTVAQMDGVRAALAARAPGRYVVMYGAKHATPLIEEAATALIEAGVDEVIGLVLTPHGSTLGSQEYEERAAAAVGSAGAGRSRFIAVPPWYGQPGLVRIVAARVEDALATMGAGGAGTSRDQSRLPVIFTAHSLPQRVADEGDTYPYQLEESARLVAEAASLKRWLVAWQSAGRTPEPWLGPDIRDVVRQLAEARMADGAVDGVVVCPIGFVTDHLEVLYDLDMELAAVARDVGLPITRTASLNDDPRFIEVLVDVICAADPGASGSSVRAAGSVRAGGSVRAADVTQGN
jgi:ferrochelatase